MLMADKNREIHELLADYAAALRDGCIPFFLRSLSRKESQVLAGSREFRDAADVVRALNGVAFADKAVTPNVSLFLSRVGAEIAARAKARGLPRGKRTTGTKSASKVEGRINKTL
jgi:hypothetical protein